MACCSLGRGSQPGQGKLRRAEDMSGTAPPHPPQSLIHLGWPECPQPPFLQLRKDEGVVLLFLQQTMFYAFICSKHKGWIDE